MLVIYYTADIWKKLASYLQKYCIILLYQKKIKKVLTLFDSCSIVSIVPVSGTEKMRQWLSW